MSEQPTGQTESQPTTTTATLGDKWGDLISEERQAELQAALDEWNAPGADHGERKGPFDRAGLSKSEQERLELTGADVCWLAEQSGRDVLDGVPNLHLERAYLYEARLKGAKLRAAHLGGANLFGAYLDGADLREAQLERAYLHLVHLEDADLWRAQLEGANLVYARLGGADLRESHLEGADLRDASLEGASLNGATLDDKTQLADAIVFESVDKRLLRTRLLFPTRYGPALGDIHWGDFDLVQLTQLQGWDAIYRLADERSVTWRSEADDHRRVVRAYRQVAQRLRDQGYSDVADRLSDRAQVLNRKLLFRVMLDDWGWGGDLERLPGDLVRWLFSWFLALLAGYGYHPGRSVFWYLATIAGFMWGYLQVTHGAPLFGLHEPAGTTPLQWYEALVLSVSSFHGRGFFPQGINLGDPVAILAASEAVIGLIIEISFIATFTQRFFGAK